MVDNDPLFPSSEVDEDLNKEESSLFSQTNHREEEDVYMKDESNPYEQSKN